MQAIIIFLLLLFIVIRSLKYLLIINFTRNYFIDLKKNPKVSLVQPISRGATNLESNLISRFNQKKLIKIQHILVCDELDEYSISLCKKLQSKYKKNHITLLLAKKEKSAVASKIIKMNLGLKKATGEVVAFIDDDIELLKDSLYRLVQHLYKETDTGVVFGLPIAASSENLWSKINTSFVNSQAFFSYIPITYILRPFTITGHVYLIKRSVFYSVNGFNDMKNQFHDDNELALRLKKSGYCCVQTDVTYKVHNYLSTFRLLINQLKRWFMMPRKSILQNSSLTQKLVIALLSLDFFIPVLLLLAFIVMFSAESAISLVSCLFFYVLIDQIHYHRYLKTGVEPPSLISYPLVLFVIPLVVIMTLITSNSNIYWRGQKLKLKNHGYYEVLE